MSRVEIYELHKKDDKWQRPKNMFYKGRDKSKWCDFHMNYSHVIDDCKDLRGGIKDLVRRATSSSTNKQEQIKSPHPERLKTTVESR